MSRTSQIMNRIELAAKKFEMDIEHVIDILEGKHPTHQVIVKPVEAESPNSPAPAPSVEQASNTTPDSAAAAEGSGTN